MPPSAISRVVTSYADLEIKLSLSNLESADWRDREVQLWEIRAGCASEKKQVNQELFVSTSDTETMLSSGSGWSCGIFSLQNGLALSDTLSSTMSLKCASQSVPRIAFSSSRFRCRLSYPSPTLLFRFDTCWRKYLTDRNNESGSYLRFLCTQNFPHYSYSLLIAEGNTKCGCSVENLYLVRWPDMFNHRYVSQPVWYFMDVFLNPGPG